VVIKTAEEYKLLTQLLAELDGKPAFEKRMQLIGEALERMADPKRSLSTGYGVGMRRARIPALEGVPFLLKFLDHKAGATKRTAMHMLGEYESEAKAVCQS
jgi:hypothetical protein